MGLKNAMRNHLHQHWAATGPLVETEPSQHVQAKAAWVARRAAEAGLSADEQRVAELTVAHEMSVPAAAQKLRMRPKTVKDLRDKAVKAMFRHCWDIEDAAREFERTLLRVVENKADHDDRPAGMRGVTPDPASYKFQGSRIIGFGDVRIEQSGLSAVQMAAREATFEHPHTLAEARARLAGRA